MSQPKPSTASRSRSPELAWLGRWFVRARRDGFLARLAPEAWHTLSGVLSFTSREGQRRFTLEQLGLTLGVAPAEARARLERLAECSWQDELLLVIERSPDGEVVGVVLTSIELFQQVQAADAEAAAAAPALAAPRDAALAHKLEQVGLDPDQVERLLHDFPADRIRRQMEWLPERHARNPAALLIRAVEQDWSAPREDG